MGFLFVCFLKVKVRRHREEAFKRVTRPHWTDTRNQWNVGLIRAQLQVKESFASDCIQFHHCIEEKEVILNAAGSSEECHWKRKQKEQKSPTVSWD